jgi:hypothetical protein
MTLEIKSSQGVKQVENFKAIHHSKFGCGKRKKVLTQFS